jgi:hypothetical protein
LTCLFTVLKAYKQAGSPGAQENPLGRFEPWSAAVCGPIRWLGFPDPVASQQRLREQDPEADKLEYLLSAWHDVFADSWVTAGKVIDEAVDDRRNHSVEKDARAVLFRGLCEAIPERKGHGNSSRFGRHLSSYTGRMAGGYRLEQKPRRGKRSKNAQQYRVVRLNESGEAK